MEVTQITHDLDDVVGALLIERGMKGRSIQQHIIYLDSRNMAKKKLQGIVSDNALHDPQFHKVLFLSNLVNHKES